MRAVDYAALTEIRCYTCCVVKPVSEFKTYNDPKQPINGWRYHTQCRECAKSASRAYGTSDRERRNARLRDWRRRNPKAASKKDLRAHLQAIYGISIQEREAIFASQGWLCAICDRKVRLVLDHNHQTGELRGGLCNRCNVRLGFIEREADVAAAAKRTAPDDVMAVLRYLGLLCDAHKDGKPFDVDCPDCAPCHGDELGRSANQ